LGSAMLTHYLDLVSSSNQTGVILVQSTNQIGLGAPAKRTRARRNQGPVGKDLSCPSSTE
jgi:hypothetical protein